MTAVKHKLARKDLLTCSNIILCPALQLTPGEKAESCEVEVMRIPAMTRSTREDLEDCVCNVMSGQQRGQTFSSPSIIQDLGERYGKIFGNFNISGK